MINFCVNNKKTYLPSFLYGRSSQPPHKIQYLRRIIILVTVTALINVLLIGVLSAVASFTQTLPSEVLVHNHEQPCQDLNTESFPKIIHQIWTTKDVPEKWHNLQEGCKKMNPDYEYKLWTHKEIDKFIQTNYPWILDTYDNYPYPMERLDAARYFILYHFGGIYIDMDMECITPFDKILHNVTMSSEEVDIILGATAPVGVTSSFLITKKNHPFMKKMTEGLPESNKWYVSPYWTVIVSTGPLYVWKSYLTYPCKNQVHVLPYDLHSKRYLDHKHASTWHSWDGPIMLFFDNHGKLLLLCALLIIIVIFIITIAKRCRTLHYSAANKKFLPFSTSSLHKHSKKSSDEAAECVKYKIQTPL